MIYTIPSISTIITKIKLTLLFEGKHRPKQIPGANGISDFSESIQATYPLSTESIIYRNELSINEASYESSYQFLGQWLTYFTLSYWISVVAKNNNKIALANVSNMDLLNTYANLSTQKMDNEQQEASEFKEISTFQILWKSGVISLAALSLCQLKYNNVQHEYSTSLLQKAFYLAASVCNTLSFSSIMLLGSVIIVDIVIMISNMTNGLVALSLFFTAICIPVTVKGLVRIVKRLFYDFHGNQKNIDEVPSVTSFKNLIAFLTGPDRGVLPTSSMKLYFNEKHYTSYTCTSCTELLNAVINHWIYYIFCCIIISVLSAVRLYLMFGEISENIFADEIIFSYAKISPARYNFQLICSIVIPLGWILENIFLFLYFKYDQGYFTGANMHFQYKKTVRFRNPNLKALTTKCTTYLTKCAYEETSSGSHVKEDVTTQLENEETIGEWVDLSGQEKYNLYKHVSKFEQNGCDDVEIHSACWNLDETENLILNGITHSFPYYRDYEAE